MRKLIRLITNIVFILAALLLISTSTVKGLVYTAVASCVIGIVITLLNIDLFRKDYIHREYIFFDLGIISLVIEAFLYRWLVSSKVASLAGRFHLTSNIFLLAVAIGLGIFAIRVLDELIHIVSVYASEKASKNRVLKATLLVFIIFVFTVFQLLQMHNTSLYPIFPIISAKTTQLLLNLLVLLLVNLVLSLIFRSWKTGIIITSIIVFVWGIANYYVVEFHGSPLYLSELVNLKTAAAVALNYRFDFSFALLTNLFLFAAIIQTVWNNLLFEKSYLKSRMLYLLLLSAAVICAVGIRSFLNRNTFEESWRDSIKKEGFIMSVIKDIAVRTEVVKMPDGYDPDNLVYDKSNHSSSGLKPDIILILNETFCDLDYYSSIAPDSDYFESFYSIENAVFGHAVVPAIGGGTNNSEFELLTSKSMNLITSAAPFTYLNSDLLSRSVVKYMQELGYYTTGMHCGGATNYSRNRAYPNLGFDEIYLGPDEFGHIGSYGNRSWLDKDNYLDLIDHYQTQDNSQPKFMYLLSFQNHGGYEQNDESLDTVHTTLDFGDLTDDINEYISSIQLSSEAINYLTNYFSKSERPVIICMVGDHAPPFINKIQSNTVNGDKDQNFTKRVVPYMLWSNYDSDFNHDYYEYASMTDLIPMILDAADLPMSGFYQTILNLHKDYPVRVTGNLVMDKNGEFKRYDSEMDEFRKITEYYWLEYNSMMPAGEYRQEIFSAE